MIKPYVINKQEVLNIVAEGTLVLALKKMPMNRVDYKKVRGLTVETLVELLHDPNVTFVAFEDPEEVTE